MFGIFGVAGKSTSAAGKSTCVAGNASGSSSKPSTYSAHGHPRGQSRGANAADEHLTLRCVAVDEVIAVLDRSAQSGIGGSDLLVEKSRQQRAALRERKLIAEPTMPAPITTTSYITASVADDIRRG